MTIFVPRASLGAESRVDTQRAVLGEVPGLHLPLAVHPHQKVVGLIALERDRPQSAMAVPGQEVGERPPAEPAVVVEEDHRAPHPA